MGRKSVLTDEQWEAIRQRLLKGETSRSIAEDFPISAGAIRQRFGKIAGIATQSDQVQETARKLADAQLALQALPPVNRPAALDLAASLQEISAALARTAAYTTKTSLRAAALANSEMAKVDDADPMSEKSLNALKGVSALPNLSNEASSIGLNLLNANRDRMPATEADETPSIDVSKLSNETLMELLSAARPR